MASLQNPLRYSIMGVPIDALSVDEVMGRIDDAIIGRSRLFLSTVNTNFLVASHTSPTFHTSLLISDLCTADGIGVLLIGRMLGVRIGERTTGSDILERLLRRQASRLQRPVRAFILGGAEGVADLAGQKINLSDSSSLCCVGTLNPGFGTMDDLSRPEVLQAINDAHPDFLIVSLGAERGQAWLTRNAAKLDVPVYSHFGAAVNFLAGTVQRAPAGWRALGLEWAWRIKEEPHLASRYFADGRMLLRLLFQSVLPLVSLQQWDRVDGWLRAEPFGFDVDETGDTIRLTLREAAVGIASIRLRDGLEQAYHAAADSGRPVVLDLRNLTSIDAVGIGAILRLRQSLDRIGLPLDLLNASTKLRRRLRLASADWLFTSPVQSATRADPCEDAFPVSAFATGQGTLEPLPQ